MTSAPNNDPAPSAASAGFDFATWSHAALARVELALDDWVSPKAPAGLGEAMRYAVLGGGKRLRPLLVLAADLAAGSNAGAALRGACAVELIHAYSLVHDDMPCMDNDILRRGKPTVHVKFGQAQALLSGDALQALAFELLTPDGDDVPPSMQATLCRLLARAAGHEGMAGGQAIDLSAVGRRLSEAELRHMHRCKTGALLHASVMMGACTQPALAPAALAALSDYGWAVGLAFQVVDDILDVTGDAATLGKTIGKDAAADKPTYVSILGMDASKSYARELHLRAGAALAQARGAGVDPAWLAALAALADVVVDRQF